MIVDRNHQLFNLQTWQIISYSIILGDAQIKQIKHLVFDDYSVQSKIAFSVWIPPSPSPASSKLHVASCQTRCQARPLPGQVGKLLVSKLATCQVSCRSICWQVASSSWQVASNEWNRGSRAQLEIFLGSFWWNSINELRREARPCSQPTRASHHIWQAHLSCRHPHTVTHHKWSHLPEWPPSMSLTF